MTARRQTDGRRRPTYPISSSKSLVSGELIIMTKLVCQYIIKLQFSNLKDDSATHCSVRKMVVVVINEDIVRIQWGYREDTVGIQ